MSPASQLTNNGRFREFLAMMIRGTWTKELLSVLEVLELQLEEEEEAEAASWI